MRLDKFLKVSRMIKRRTVANDACSAGIVELQFGARVLTAEILSLSEHVRKEEAADMYRILSEN